MNLPASLQWQRPQPYPYPYRTGIATNAPAQNVSAGLTIKEQIQYSLLGLVLAGGAVYLISRAIKKARAGSEQNKTLEEGNAPTYAKRIKMAFDNDGWWGTDKETLRQAVRDIPSKSEFRKVMASYHKLYNRSLLGDMQSELKSTEYNEMLSIVSVKPETGRQDSNSTVTVQQISGWAKRLKAAFDIHYGPFPGTDEPAIKAVFTEIPNQYVFAQVAVAYQKQFGSDFMADLKSELEFWEYDPMMQLILGKPKN